MALMGWAGMRMHWFRYSAQQRQWTEHYNRVGEEMYHTLISFQKYEARWLAQAEECDIRGDLGAASHARR